MSFEISWLVEKRVAHVRIYGNIDIEETRRQREAIKAFCLDGISPVHVIVDTREVKKIPMSPSQMKEMKPDPTRRKGWTLIITNSAVIRFIATLVIQMVNVEYKFMDSLEESLNYLYQLEPELQQREINEAQT